MVFDRYRSRLNVGGSNITEVYKNSAKQFINQSFKDAHNYRQVTINDESVDVRVIDEKSNTTRSSGGMLSFAKTLLFKPDTVIKRGAYATLDAKTWLVSDFLESLPPKATILLCNSTFNIRTGTDKVIAGYDALDRPIINETPIYTPYPCVVDVNIQNLTINDPINAPVGVIAIMVPNNQYVVNDMDFTMWDEEYKVIGINRALVVGDEGVLIVTAKRQV